MPLVFRCIAEASPGLKWQALLERMWPAYESWFLREGEAARPRYIECVRELRRHMPELMPVYESLVDLAGGGDVAARLLSLYRPTPYLTGCSQAVLRGAGGALVRNYDYVARAFEGTILRSEWTGRGVIAGGDCLWGALDGINDSGLAVSLAFGGRPVVGDGFGIPLVLRYILELCETASEAVSVLRRVPVHMAYTVTVLDERGRWSTVYVAPDREAIVTERPVATNHQLEVEWEKHARATGTLERESFLLACLEVESRAERLAGRFLGPPLFTPPGESSWGTLYTAVYEPAQRSATYLWPGRSVRQGMSSFSECEIAMALGAGGRAGGV